MPDDTGCAFVEQGRCQEPGDRFTVAWPDGTPFVIVFGCQAHTEEFDRDRTKFEVVTSIEHPTIVRRVA